MEISCLPVSFFDDIMQCRMSIGNWAALAKRAGLLHIDLSAMFLHSHTPIYLDALRSSLEEQQMQIGMITTYPDFSHPSRIQREREAAYLRRDIALAAQLGAPYLRITAGQRHPGTARAAGIANVAEQFLRAADFADSQGVVLVYENHAKPGAWHEIDFSAPTEIFLEILSHVRGSSIRVNFDTANPVAYRDEAEAVSLLKQVLPQLETVHIADTSTRGTLHHTVIGTGLVPFDELFAILREAGFDGLFSIEEGSCTGFDGVKTAVDFVQEKWNASSRAR